jgi:lactate dehydrogenase-like 2-hydroxyacid dehydrogenase
LLRRHKKDTIRFYYSTMLEPMERFMKVGINGMGRIGRLALRARVQVIDWTWWR